MSNDLQHRLALLLAAESERALTAEERLEQMARERDKEREEWASRRCECSASDSCKMARERDEARAQLAELATKKEKP
jgi:hypothetical protein